jgi:hypothetical protein
MRITSPSTGISPASAQRKPPIVLKSAYLFDRAREAQKNRRRPRGERTTRAFVFVHARVPRSVAAGDETVFVVVEGGGLVSE